MKNCFRPRDRIFASITKIATLSNRPPIIYYENNKKIKIISFQNYVRVDWLYIVSERGVSTMLVRQVLKLYLVSRYME